MPATVFTRRRMAVLLAGLLAMSAADAAELPPHPRLFADQADVAAIATRAEGDPLLATLRDATLAAAGQMQSRRTCEYRIPDGRRLLAESRRALDTILHTAMAWRLSGDRRHFDRCVQELDAACGLTDWHPPHFLDTAEMATAVAIGLDWLHDDLDEGQRGRYREALVAKAIVPAREEFEQQVPWTRVNNNWSQVCGAGIALACLAAARDPAELAASPWQECLRVVAASSRFYEPDGCYPEGPGYWDYGTGYHVAALAAVESLGRPEPVPTPLLRGAAFMAHARGPTGMMFNFADAQPTHDKVVAARSWLAARSKDPALVADVRRGLESLAGDPATAGSNDRFFPLHLLWLPPAPDRAASLPLAAAFRGEQPMAAFRSSWDDPDAVFVAVKGGTPKASHGHMDVGAFVVEALGRRWIHDLGPDDYNLPDYFRGKRWNYFRVNSRSHNVLSIDGALQNAASSPCGIAADTGRPPYRARIDLSPAYAPRSGPLAAGVTREVSLDPDDRVVRIRDVVTQPAGLVRWQALVDVEPAIEGGRAVLTDGDRELELVLRISPRSAASAAGWQVDPARPSTPQEQPNDGFWLLSCTAGVGPRVTFDVEIRPRGTGDGGGGPRR
jgi:hypothetical protein